MTLMFRDLFSAAALIMFAVGVNSLTGLLQALN